MTDLITEARELCERATPGPWRLGEDETIEAESDCIAHRLNTLQDAQFIARSRTLIPELCDALEKAAAKNDELIRELSELARESVKRDVALAKLEAEVRASLHEAQERDKGCDHCNLIYKLDGASYGTTDEIIDNKFCPMCGKRLEEYHEAD